MAERALRCLAIAQKTALGDFDNYDGDHHSAHEQLQDPANYPGIESELTFLGLTGLQVELVSLQNPPPASSGCRVRFCSSLLACALKCVSI